MDTGMTLFELAQEEDRLIAHTLYLCNTIRTLLEKPEKFNKVNRLLGFLQACVSLLNLYTVDDLRNHNR